MLGFVQDLQHAFLFVRELLLLRVRFRYIGKATDVYPVFILTAATALL